MDAVEANVMRLECELLEPSVRADALRLDQLLAEDFLEVGATGRAFGKPDVLGRLPSESGIRFATSEMRAQVLAENVVLVTYLATRTHAGQARRSWRSSIWILSPQGWQMRYHQGTYCG